MKPMHTTIAMIALAVFAANKANAAKTEPPQPNSPVTTESVGSKEVLRTKPSDYPIISPTESIFYWPARSAERYKSFEVKECDSAFTAYHRFFETMFPEPESLMNECALGPLIDMNKLMGFDPIGGILNAIKGAMCGFIKNEIHDPFIEKINKPMSRANQWINSTNQSYADFIDQETRNLQQSLYDPTSRYDKSGLQFPGSLPPPNGTYPGDRPTVPVPAPTTPAPIINETPEEREARIRQETLDSGGTVIDQVIDENGNIKYEFNTKEDNSPDWNDIYNPGSNNNNDWTDIYNIYNSD